MKRWNPAKDVDGKTERPVCEQLPQHGARCLQSCRNLIVESNGMHGCLELDFKHKMVMLADHVISIGTPTTTTEQYDEPIEGAESLSPSSQPPPPPPDEPPEEPTKDEGEGATDAPGTDESPTEPPDTAPDGMLPIEKQDGSKPPLAPGQTVGKPPPSTGKPASLSPTGKRGSGKPGKGK